MKIYTLGNLPQDLYDAVGGKARGLDFLKKNGYRIASGFVVTDIEAPDDADMAGIEAAFDALGATRVSVRSSATNEDGAAFSNAGQYETCLDVTRETLREAVKTCAASLHSARAAAYAETFSGGEEARINLVVEEMIDAAFAGVMFTADPQNGENVLIEAVRGKGEQLVSGSAAAYRYSIPKSGFVFKDAGGPEEKTLCRLYDEGLAVADLFGAAADLEWVVDARGDLYWLQLRPITTQNDCDADEFNPAHSLENHLLTSRNIGEMMPGAVTPLSISTSLLAIDYGLRNMLRVNHTIRSESDRPDFYAALAFKYHLFIDMSALHTMSYKVMMATNEAMNLSIIGEHVDNYPKAEGKNAFFPVKCVNGVRFAKYLFSAGKAKEDITAVYDELVFTAERDARAIYDEITEKLPLLNRALCDHYVCSSFSGAMNNAFYQMLDGVDPAERRNIVSALLCDIDGIESADILRSLRALGAAVLRLDPKAADLDDKALLALVTDEQNEEVYALYRDFLQKHGHRSIKEAEMRSKPWKRDPISLMNNLRTVMRADRVEQEAKPPFDIEALLTPFRGLKKKIARWIGTNARSGVRDREFTKSGMIRVIDKFKDRYVLLAALLTEEGLLYDEDCIYFLAHDEIGKLISGDASLKRRAVARRAVFGEAESLTFDTVCVGTPKPVEADAGETAQTLTGISVSRGKVFGRARIVRSYEDALKIRKGEIMVAPFTDIGWSPYYSLIGALVTEVGSALSHGAVVAREYCLPTVVNVKNATKLLRDGDLLCVDASAGTVRVMREDAPAPETERQPPRKEKIDALV